MSPDSPQKTPLLIHVGYHKTGTTWLQRILFQPEYGYHPVLVHEEIFPAIVRPHGLTFDPGPVRELVATRRGAGGAGSADVISSEILVGNPFYGGRESDQYAYRLKEIFPDAKILLSIREQLRALTSIYMQYISRGGTQKPAEFFADDPVIGYFAFASEHLEYHRLIGLYRDLFGYQNVHVATQEALARDPRAVARELAAFAGVTKVGDLEGMSVAPMSPSPAEFSAPLLRRINHFRSGPAGLGPVLNLGGVSARAYQAIGALGRTSSARAVFGKSQPVMREVKRRFDGRYAQSNRELKAMLGDRIDISRYQM